MPSRKAETIVKVLRDDILSGRRAPREKLPTYDALIEQFGVTRPTVSFLSNGVYDDEHQIQLSLQGRE